MATIELARDRSISVSIYASFPIGSASSSSPHRFSVNSPSIRLSPLLVSRLYRIIAPLIPHTSRSSNRSNMASHFVAGG